ncbi:helix-turn-helix domain-containing protein [Fodinicurvata sediminis]|uniref:helix-turn-helix domain-containing protein n=1 Tax=Fodinicurvata sediminis TaxID=1121832 RepID=UPI0003B42193|nr:helix-turn-helix domain-containing protein [Fodinicurvata sediminis]
MRDTEAESEMEVAGSALDILKNLGKGSDVQLPEELMSCLSALDIEPHHIMTLAFDPAYLDSAINEQDAAALLGVEVPTLRRWRQVGDGPPFMHIGRLVRYRRADLFQWMRGCRMRHGKVPLEEGL